MLSARGTDLDDENYYLVAYDAAAGIIKHYRVDKMQNTEILETDRKGEDSFKNFDLAAFAKEDLWYVRRCRCGSPRWNARMNWPVL